MREHVTRGVSIVDGILSELGVEGLPHTDVLRNVVLRHHEAFDGSGYPDGLAGLAIPLEGRIVAVADVFDALTSVRPYKGAWSREEALGYLRGQAGRQFDGRCVEALDHESDSAEAIRLRFPDEDRKGSPSRGAYPADLQTQ
jgi:HD-GYP domain-containing protein (c-di-GMP phosphodiesterase class II)